MPITQHFTCNEEVRCQEKPRTVGYAIQSVARAPSNAGLVRPICNGWRQPRRREKRVGFLRTNRRSQFPELDSFASALDAEAQLKLLKPSPRGPAPTSR